MPTVDQSYSQRIREKKGRTLITFSKKNPAIKQQGSVSMGLDTSIYMGIKEGNLFISKDCCDAPVNPTQNTQKPCSYKCKNPQSFQSTKMGGCMC
jgi:hypothetical protein